MTLKDAFLYRYLNKNVFIRQEDPDTSQSGDFYTGKIIDVHVGEVGKNDVSFLVLENGTRIFYDDSLTTIEFDR